MEKGLKREKIRIRGRVQGVGCRPFVYRLARGLFLAGFVKNDTQGVTIEVQGAPESISLFIERLRDRSFQDYPALMDIACINLETFDPIDEQTDFQIIQSDSAGSPLSQVTPDCATCPACLKEMQTPDNFRFHYPFINCTHCGPRYSIVKSIPYDRPNTTMSPFEMCPQCRAEYEDVKDRRFHAQPVACPQCGPQIQLLNAEGQVIETVSDKAIRACANALLAGQIAAGLAHEVRNPLFALSATVDAFEARFGGREEFRRYLGTLRKEVDRVAELVEIGARI